MGTATTKGIIVGNIPDYCLDEVKSCFFINNRLREEDGAGIDVLEEEPISSGHPFLKIDNVILTPHAALYSKEAELESKRKAAQNVVDVLLGSKLTLLVIESKYNSM